jgi:hypothetical protein
MPIDTLGDDVQRVVREAKAFLGSKNNNTDLRQSHLRDLEAVSARLSNEIEERRTRYIGQLGSDERAQVDNQWAQLNAKPQFNQANRQNQTNLQIFESLRQINGGAYPRDLSPVLYVIPLVLVGLAEWYVNFATFEATFIPVFAIAGTLLVAAVFAWASHMHGAYVKQIAEIIHPSTEYRNVLGRKIALVIATILLIGALATVVWLRYSIIAEQLGSGLNTEPGTFGGPSTSTIWSKLGPTIVLNILIWGLGALYAWAMNEKVPGLRESYRDWQRSEKKLKRLRRPFEKEVARINASFTRKREQNQVAINEYNHSLSDVHALIERLRPGR